MLKHFCNNEENCNTKMCVVCELPNVVCESSFTRSRYLDGPCCEACEHKEAIINYTKPKWDKEKVLSHIRIETAVAALKASAEIQERQL